MTTAGEEFARRFVAAMNAHDIEAVAACYDPAAVIRYPGRPVQNVVDYTNGERGMLVAVPDYHIEATSVIEGRDGSVVIELKMGGTQREDLGGRAFAVTGAYVFKLEAGKVVEERAYPDIAGLRRQLSGK